LCVIEILFFFLLLLLKKNVYLQSVFTICSTINKWDVGWLVGEGSHPMVAPRRDTYNKIYVGIYFSNNELSAYTCLIINVFYTI